MQFFPFCCWHSCDNIQSWYLQLAKIFQRISPFIPLCFPLCRKKRVLVQGFTRELPADPFPVWWQVQQSLIGQKDHWCWLEHLALFCQICYLKGECVLRIPSQSEAALDGCWVYIQSKLFQFLCTVINRKGFHVFLAVGSNFVKSQVWQSKHVLTCVLFRRSLASFAVGLDRSPSSMQNSLSTKCLESDPYSFSLRTPACWRLYSSGNN